MTWQQAESWCSAIEEGWHLASLTTPQEFETTKDKLLAASANRTVYKNEGGLLGCGEGDDVYNGVWTGLHDPSNVDAKGATWQQVAATFIWSDGRKSPYLTQNAKDYFNWNADEQEPCIGFAFCSVRPGKPKPSVYLTKHPCKDWKMSFLCKGPTGNTTGRPPMGVTARLVARL